MRWVAYQSEFAQLSDAVHGRRTDWANKRECRGGSREGEGGPGVCCGPGARHKGINDVRETMLYLAQ